MKKALGCDGLILDVPVTENNFDEASYLAANADVAAAVRDGRITSGWQHFDTFGKLEGRYQRISVDQVQRDKIAKVRPLLNLDMHHVRRGARYDFISDELRQKTGISDTAAVSSNNYDGYVLALIEEFKSGLILDCGAGKRSVYYPNVINLEIVEYDTTDIIGVGEALPFKDSSFDAVISIAVLEHVRDPFKCAAEIARVLKPGGKLVCSVPFLQPLHGYPHHYYNMTHQGLRALFENMLTIDEQKVGYSTTPIWSLTWILKSWAAGLSGPAKEEFVSLRVSELLTDPVHLLDRSWVTELTTEKNFELASGTLLFAHKPK